MGHTKTAAVLLVLLSIAAAPASQPDAKDAKPKSTFTSRAKAIRPDNPILGANGESPRVKLKRLIAEAEKVDAAIAACEATPAIRTALYENRLKPGMTLEHVAIISPTGYWGNRVETANSLQFDCQTRTEFGSLAAIYSVGSVNGIVTVVAER